MPCAALACLSPVLALAAPNEYDCLIEPSQVVEIRSPVSGLIERINVERGALVKKGMTVASLESSVERAAADLARYKSTMDGTLKSSESRLAHANKKLRRKTDLADKNYTSVQDRDDAEAEQLIAQADALTARENKQLAQLEQVYVSNQLAQRQLRSPIDGVVTEQSMHVGELAEVGDGKPSIMKIAQINPLRVKVILPMAVYTRMKVGQKADVTPEKPLPGRYATSVSIVDKVIDAASGTFQVRMDLPNPNAALPAGVKCKVAFSGW
jgi:RND family efflux transporter MFP subunit